MTRLLVALLLACCATLGHAGSRIRPCTVWEPDPPAIAIRYWSYDPAEPGEPAFVADVGRLKFLFVDGKAPVVVHATTGHAERDRRIVATPSFFDLPAAHQRYLADKMRKIHAHAVFVFDATNQFLPRRGP